MIEYRHELPSVEQFWPLYMGTGWNDEYHITPEDIRRAFSATWHAVAAYEDGQLAGFGRIVSDGALHAMVYELIVAPGYQGRGIGGEILARLVEQCWQRGIRDIQLFCARGKREFYEKRGFVARPEDAPGMQYSTKADNRFL